MRLPILNIKNVNKRYKTFSANYFQLLNRVRKGTYLSPRRDQYRKTFHLYSQKNIKKFERKRRRDDVISKSLLIFIFSLIIPFFVVSIAHSIIAFYELVLYLYKTM